MTPHDAPLPRSLSPQPNCAELVLSLPSLLLEPSSPENLRYVVPSNVTLRKEGGIEWLVWRWREATGDERAQSRLDAAACLPRFIRLDNADSDELVAFARAWGPLGVGWRRALAEDFPPYPAFADKFARAAVDASASGAWEPVEAWRRLARQLGAALRIAVRLQHGKPTPWLGSGDADWNLVYDCDPQNTLYQASIAELYARRPLPIATEHQSADEVLALQRSAIARLLDVWLQFGGVQMVPHWDDAQPRITIRVDFNRGAGLHGLLALELASALTSPFGIVNCSGCGYPYAPTEAPRAIRSSVILPALLRWRQSGGEARLVAPQSIGRLQRRFPRPRRSPTVSGKRGNGEGSIYFQESRQRWAAALTLEHGKRRVVYGKTRQEVAKKLTAAMQRRDTGLPIVRERLTVRKRWPHQLESRMLAGKRWRGADYVESARTGFVFTGATGTVLQPRKADLYFAGVRSRAGMDSHRFHALRHDFASLLLAAGVADRVVMEMMGHSNIAMTANRYQHVPDELQHLAADRLDDVFAAIQRAQFH